MKMGKINLNIGDEFVFTKTVGESDVYLFAGITGDFTPNHIDEEFMKKTPYKTRMAHGVLSIGFASTTAGMAVEKAKQVSVSYGYDGIRFLKPVFIGDTLTTVYTVAEIDEESLKMIAKIEIFNQNKELVTVAKHIEKFFI
ncbi:MAG: MaoC domain protein dehydratase [Firmicutes bacterium]|nr:MaoC domain protein dehydratase [Bacillota bacterium]